MQRLVRTGIINEGRYLELKELYNESIRIEANPNCKDREFQFNEFCDSIMFESPSQALKNIKNN